MEYDLEQFIQKLLQRPALYVGSARLDLVQAYLAGFAYCGRLVAGQGSAPVWAYNYDIQQWLFTRESVTLHSLSIDAWGLLMRTYGKGAQALERLQTMAGGVALTVGPDARAQETIAARVTGGVAYLAEEERPDLEGLFEGLIALCRSLFPLPDKFHIYVNADLCQQVRLVWQDENGAWVDITDLANEPGYEEKLVAVHRYVYQNIKHTFAKLAYSVNAYSGSLYIHSLKSLFTTDSLYTRDDRAEDFHCFNDQYASWLTWIKGEGEFMPSL